MPDTDVHTLILRFRDLVTSPGGTIEAHRVKLAEKDHVWWGWWNKSGERVPLNVFSELSRQATSDEGLSLLLFDSGRLRLFRAHCTDILWNVRREDIPAPDNGEATPAYYTTRDYPAWFKFDSIEDVPHEEAEETLRRYTYVQVDDFFQSNASRYTKFYNKKVVSLDELRQQDRSIWFVRRSVPGDLEHEIQLLSGSSLTPAHFPSTFYQDGSTRLLWVSDLHFGDHHGFPLESDVSSGNLTLQVESAIEDNKEIAGVIVSGDLTWKAADEEFEQAKAFIRAIGRLTRVAEPYQIAVCPGNHDIRFSSNPARKGNKIQGAGPASRRAYAKFYSDFFYLQPNSYLSSGRRFLLGGTVPVEIVCLNSSLLQQSRHKFQGYGFVGDAQLRDAADKMEWDENEPHHPVRIVVVHHHIFPVTYRETPVSDIPYSVTLDAEALVRWIIKYGVKVVLHGHMHNPFYSMVTRAQQFRDGRESEHTFSVLGMGSTGVSAEHLGEIRDNMIALLDFSPHSLKVTYRRIHPTDESSDILSFDVDISDNGGT